MGESDGRVATRGLATIALLKTNFDQGRDHIAMFEPFVMDALANMTVDGVTCDEVGQVVTARHELALPINTLQTLLNRACRRGYLRRDGGRFFTADEPVPARNLTRDREEMERRQLKLAEGLCAHAASRDLTLTDPEDALGLILRFLERHHVAIVLDGAGSAQAQPPQSDEAVDRSDVITASFLRETALDGAELADILQEMVEGYVLQNALLLKDLSTANRKFDRLRVFFDSGLVFGILGLEGPASETALREFAHLLRDTGASLEVFDTTLKEMRGILAIYESRLGTPSGRKSLIPTNLTRFVLSQRLTPSDIRSISAVLEKRLRDLNFNVREKPHREINHTLGELELAGRLVDRGGDENSPRVVHDVECVAAILTLRRGRTSESWDNVGSVFVTSSGRTARSIIEWYADEDELGKPPVIHYLLLSNLAWLKRPASASRLKLHELVAVCAAALRPSRRAWTAFVRHLEKLEESGELTSDEVTAVVASSLTDDILVEEGIDEDSDAASLTEVVDRVKASYSVEVEKGRAALDLLTTTLDRRALAVGEVVSWAVAGLLGLCVGIGAVISVDNALRDAPVSGLAVALFVFPLALLGLLGVLWGFSLRAWRTRVRDAVTNRVRAWLSPPEGTG